jgi:hypothetical protein
MFLNAQAWPTVNIHRASLAGVLDQVLQESVENQILAHVFIVVGMPLEPEASLEIAVRVVLHLTVEHVKNTSLQLED